METNDQNFSKYGSWFHVPSGEPEYIYQGDYVTFKANIATPEQYRPPFNTADLAISPGDQFVNGDDYWIFVRGKWYQLDPAEWEAVYRNSTHPKWKPRLDDIGTESFEWKINQILECAADDVLQEGVILNINAMVSSAIRVPQGDYIIAISDSDKCTLISTNEASKCQKFEVFRHTLAGFFNPDIHKKTKQVSDGKTIAEGD